MVIGRGGENRLSFLGILKLKYDFLKSIINIQTLLDSFLNLVLTEERF